MAYKGRLIRGFSHNVKNPLGAADGYAHLLEEGLMGGITARQRTGIRRIRRSIGTALRIINQLVEPSRAEAGKLDIEWEAVDPRQVVRGVADEHEAAAAAAGLTLRVDLPARLPRTRTDPARAQQVLGNLLERDHVHAGGRHNDYGAGTDGGRCPRLGRWLAIGVSDTGPGIPGELRERIFEEFSRLEPGTETGAGLGLAISRRIARLLGGNTTVDAEVGEGSTFTLWLPLSGTGDSTARRSGGDLVRARPSRG